MGTRPVLSQFSSSPLSNCSIFYHVGVLFDQHIMVGKLSRLDGKLYFHLDTHAFFICKCGALIFDWNF